MGCEHSRSTVAFPLLFPSSVEGGGGSQICGPLLSLWKIISLCKELVVQEQGGLGETSHLFRRIVAVWRSSLYPPTVPPLGSPPRPQAWCPAAMPAGAGSHQAGLLPPKSPQTLPAVSASSCSTQGGFSSLETYLFSPGDSVTPRAGT